ncbi:site-specific integrase [Aeromonas rivipollensis]|uniref:Site-specific integrase n=1 Tax=Aeromonas rivipollensis TaxID=948519 RepID=A0AAW9YB74_9GAMM|nr:site-specific integrase [Aeromonas rivipollensis]NEX75068.1 site-specific integrase [Aeromonas rivipollensis]
MTTDNTKLEYAKLATHFYKRLHDKSIPLTAKNIADELSACAPEYRPAYWRRLRCALVYHQDFLGYGDASKRIHKVINLVTVKSSTVTVKPKQNRVKTISLADEVALIDYFKQRNDISMIAAIRIFQLSGIRPAELANITVESNKLIIVGAKKSHNGTRGADRVLQFEGADPQILQYLVRHAQMTDIGSMQDRLRSAGKRLWPRRKSVPTFYSWRHQLGSELKRSGLDRLHIAYLMGHQATASVDRYGNRKTAKGGKLPSCPTDADLSQIRITHNPLPVDNKNYCKSAMQKTEPESKKEDNSNISMKGLAAYISR